MLSRILICFCLVGLRGAAMAGADPIKFAESVSGDLGQLPSDSPVFDLAIGSNVFSGTFGFGYTFTDFDAFAFSIPSGTQLTGIRYSFDVALFPQTFTANTQFTLFSDNVPPIDTSDGLLLANLFFVALPPRFPLQVERAAFERAMPLQPGVYGLSHSAMGFNYIDFDLRAGFSLDYTWTLNVQEPPAPVPEPMSMLLVGTGLCGIGARQWRQRRAAKSKLTLL